MEGGCQWDEVSFQEEGNVLTLMVEMYNSVTVLKTPNHIDFKWENCIEYELHLNKDVILKS